MSSNKNKNCFKDYEQNEKNFGKKIYNILKKTSKVSKKLNLKPANHYFKN